jgi:hypothetical protein
MRFDRLLKRLRPTSKWHINDEDVNDYSKIRWMDENTSLPTYEDFENEWNIYLNEEGLAFLRQRRNILLEQTDKYIVADWPHPTPEVRQAWLNYRQALRDLPSVTEDPTNPVWPVQPTA